MSMRVYVFACNAMGCEEVTGDIVPPNPDDGARSAWRVAKQDGWTDAGGNLHYCFGHGRDSRVTNGRRP